MSPSSSDGEDSQITYEIDAATLLGEQLIDSILSREPIAALNEIIQSGAPLWYQNTVEGISALHAAAYIENFGLVNLLIKQGAIWNAVDNFNRTAGDIALSFNNTEIYTAIRDAGLRSELLLNVLSNRAPYESPSALVLRASDTSATGSTDAFLDSKLRFTQDQNGQNICFLSVEGEEVGVMMGWETEIMQQTVQKLCHNHPNAQHLKILNVGFGLGIIDTLFQSLPSPPSQHVIIEPHSDVLQHMKNTGWSSKPGVKILEGKWRSFMGSSELLGIGGFDIIYTDTFSEDYSDLCNFFGHLPVLLSGPESRFSFFNGLGATSALFYDVYTRISELHLSELGIDVHWSSVMVALENEEDRWGESRKYFTLPIYFLPVGSMKTEPKQL